MPQRPTMSSGATLGRGIGPAGAAGGGESPQFDNDNEFVVPEQPASARPVIIVASGSRMEPAIGGLLRSFHRTCRPHVAEARQDRTATCPACPTLGLILILLHPQVSG